MSDLIKQQYSSPKSSATKTARLPLCTALLTGLLLSIMPLLTGCGGGETSGVDPSTPSARATASLAWSPVSDPSVSAYFVHYGRQPSPDPGICAYENSISVNSPSVTVTDLDPNTTYYFAVSAYNGLESACSDEVSTVTPPNSVQIDPRDPSPAPEMPIGTRGDVLSDAPIDQRPQ